jgi:putative acetyltransferase
VEGEGAGPTESGETPPLTAATITKGTKAYEDHEEYLMNLETVAVDPRGADAQALLGALTAEITAMYADLGYDGTGGFAVADLDVPRAVFVIAYADGEPVGCGALRPYKPDIAEVKRMHTVPHWRGQGVAAAVLAELERQARAFGYPTVRLETGDRQTGAIRLYERSGYCHIPSFGPYVAWSDSVCFEKPLTPTNEPLN